MLRFLFVGLIISVFLVSGCVDKTTGETTTTTIEGVETGPITGALTEDQALDIIEQEMEQAIEDIDVSDVEDSLVE